MWNRTDFLIEMHSTSSEDEYLLIYLIEQMYSEICIQYVVI